jgi:hypothetical protein
MRIASCGINASLFLNTFKEKRTEDSAFIYLTYENT